MTLPIRVLLADDHEVVRAGLEALLSGSDAVTVVGTAQDGVEAIARVHELTPDVVLMDLGMPRLGGVDATREILAEHPNTRVLIVTTYESDDEIVRAIAAGAAGYLLKAAPAAELIAGIRSVAAGELALSPSVARALARAASRPERTEPVLSARELDVIRLVARGLTNRAIGTALFVTEATVKTYLARVFDKLEVTDRTHAVTRAIELGLFEDHVAPTREGD